MENRLFEKPVYFIPIGEPVSNGDHLGKFHLADTTRLHINKLIEYINSRSDLNILLPEKTLFLTNDLPQGSGVVNHLKDNLGEEELNIEISEVLYFDFSVSTYQEKLINNNIGIISNVLKKASYNKYELIVIIGDNSFPIIMDRVGERLSYKVSFVEFSKKGRLLNPIVVEKPHNDSTHRASKKIREKHVGTTLIAGRQYYIRKDRAVVTISDCDECAAGTLFTGSINSNSPELFWLPDGRNPYTADYDIIERI